MMKIVLDQYRNIQKTNQEKNIKLNLNSSLTKKNEFDVNYVLNVSDRYDVERQRSKKYYFYGSIEYLSILNNLSDNTDRTFKDFFIKKYENNTLLKNIYNSFFVYLVIPHNEGYQHLGDNLYKRKFKVISEHNEIIINQQSYSTNIFKESKYNFLINKDIIIDNVDYFNIPITDVYLMFVYRCSGIGDQTYSDKLYINNIEYDDENDFIYNVGDIVDGDVVRYDEENYTYTIHSEVEYQIKTFYNNNIENYIKWKYNPFINIKFDYLSDELYNENDTDLIPDHANKVNNVYIWRNVLDKGYIDPLTNYGVDYPFINGKHYIYATLLLSIKPDMNDLKTNNIFKDIKNSFGNSINNINTINNNVCM